MAVLVGEAAYPRPVAWILRIEPGGDDIDAISAKLWDLGTTGIAECHAPSSGDPPAAPCGLPPSRRRTVALLAGFATEEEADTAAAALAAWMVATTIEPVDANAWVDQDRRSRVELPTGVVELAVGAAFGSGDHPTTRLALDLLLPMIAAGTTVLDFGTGTGILAVAAAASGAAAILAVDDDPDALAVAEANLAAHSPEATVGLAASLHGALPMPPGGFDVTVANVLLPVHRSHGRELIGRTAPNGSIVVSGVLATQREELLAQYPGWTPAAERHGATPTGARRGDHGDDRWLGLRLVAADHRTRS